MNSKVLFLIFLIIPFLAFSQNKEDREILNALQENISKINLLSNGNSSASPENHYVQKQFQEDGLQPALDNNSYLQPIITNYGVQFIPGTGLSIHNHPLEAGKDFIPLPYSGQGTVSGDPLISVQEANLPWIIDISNYSGTQLTGTDTNDHETMYKLAAQAMHDKATAVLFYNSNNASKDVSFHATDSKTPLTIPVVYINHAAASRYFKDQTADAPIELQVKFYDKKDTTYNVIGIINHGTASTIILTAYQPGDKAALIALSRLIKSNKRYEKENYLFVAFSGKKGAGYFMEHPVINMDQADCMINLNGAGNLSSSSDNLIVSGMQSSPQWESVLRRVKSRGISLQKNEDIPENSDGNIPALTFSNNTNGNISAENELKVVNYLAELIRELNRTGKLPAAGH